MSDHASFPGTRAGQDKEWTATVTHGSLLRFVERHDPHYIHHLGIAR